MDERRRHGEPSRNRHGMGYDVGVQRQQEDMSYVDQLLQDNRNEQFVDRTTNHPSMYGHHSNASYYETHSNHGSSYANWQRQAGNLSNPPNLYSPQTYPNYPSYDHNRFVTGQPPGNLPYPGYREYDVHRTPLHASQSLPSTLDSRPSSWHNETYRNDCTSIQASAQGHGTHSTPYGTTGSKVDVNTAQIPQVTLSNNYSANSGRCVNHQNFNNAYDGGDRRGMPINYQAPNVAKKQDHHSDINKPEGLMPLPSTQRNYSDSCQTNLESPVHVPLPESTSNSKHGDESVPTLSQEVENVSNDGIKQSEHHESCLTGEKTSRQHSSCSTDEQASLSSTQNDSKSSGAICDHPMSDDGQNCHKVIHKGQGDDRKGTLTVSQESSDQSNPVKISEAEQEKMSPTSEVVGVEIGERTKSFEKVSTPCKSDPIKVEATMDNVNCLPELGNMKNTSSELPVSVTTDSQDTSAVLTDETISQGFHNVEDASVQNLSKENSDDNVNVKEVSSPKNTPTTFRTTVDLSAVEQGCSTVVKFEDGTCTYIKEEPRNEQDEESFYCTNQQTGGWVQKQKMGPSEEDNPAGAPGDKNHLAGIKLEDENAEQNHQLGSNSVKESLNNIVKLEVDDGNRSQNPGASDASRHDAVPQKASDLYPDEDHMESNYDSDGWQVGSDKQDQDSSSKCSTRETVNDDGMLDRCPICNELIACSGMIEHLLKCKAEPNLNEVPVHLQSPKDDEATLKCPECGVGFETTDDLVIHLRIHEMLAKSAFKMKEDNRMMLMTEEMGKQMTNTEDMMEGEPEECGVCYESFTDPTMVPYHNMMHQQFPFHCRKCNLFFSSLTELHKSRCSDQKHHKVFKYRCRKCKGALLDSYKMRKHRKRCEGKMETCRLCQQKFSTFKQLALHAEICNAEQKKKEMEKAEECGQTGVAVEESVSDIEIGDHDSLHHQDQDVGSEIKSEGRPIKAETREPLGRETDCPHSIDESSSPKTVIEMNENSQLSEENSCVVRCKGCEKELPISLRYHGRSCKESPEYCKACLNMVKSTKVNAHDNSSASQKSLNLKRTLPTGSNSSIEESCDNAIVEPSKKKHKKIRQDGETCGACGKWFKNFKKLEKHAARCDGVEKKRDRGACPEPSEQPNDDINLEWKGPSVLRCPKCDKKFVKEKKLKKHVKSCRWIKDGVPSAAPSAVLDDASDLEDELPLSAIRNANGAVDDAMEASNETSKVESPFESSTVMEKVDKGQSDQCVNEMPDSSAKEAGETCGACGKWFRSFKKLQKHAEGCDGVVKKNDSGACPEPTKQPNDDINLDWKGPTVFRCPKCEKKFVKEKKLKKHVKSCRWSQDGVPSVAPSAVLDDASDLEDELPLSSIRDANGAVDEESGKENACDTVEPSLGTVPVETMETSNETSRVESSTLLEEVSKGQLDQSVSDRPENSDPEAEKCIYNGNVPSFQNERSFSEIRIVQDDATSGLIDDGNSCNPNNASGASKENKTKESSVVVAESTEQPLGMETSQMSDFDEETEISNSTSNSAAQQVTLVESESVPSSSQHFIEVPAQDKSIQNISHETIPQDHLTQGDKSDTLHRKNMPPPSRSDTCPRKDFNELSFTQAMQTTDINTVDSANSAQEMRNKIVSPSSLLASPPSTGVIIKESESNHPEKNLKEPTDLGEYLEGMHSKKVGEDIESHGKDESVVNAEPEQVSRVIDKASSLPVIGDVTNQFPGQSTEDAGTRGPLSQFSSNLQGVHAAQARSPTHTASFQDSTIDKTKASFELMSGVEGKRLFSELREESSLDSSVEVEYAMSLGAGKGTSFECEIAPSHHCVYCAAEFSSRDDLWQHARGCRDNHLMVIASHVAGKKEYQLVEKPVTWGKGVPWQVTNDYTKKEAMEMKKEIGIDLSCVMPNLGYIPSSHKPVQSNVKNKKKKKKKKKKIMDKEEMEKEKQREIERKKRRKRERKREKLLVQAKLQQLEQNPGKKFRDKEKQKIYTCDLCNRRFHCKGHFGKHKLSHVSALNKKTLSVCVEKLDVNKIDNFTEFKSTREQSDNSNTMLKKKKLSEEKHTQDTESKLITKKKKSTTKNRPVITEEKNEQAYVDVESLEGNDNGTEQAENKKRSSNETPQGTVELSSHVQTFAPSSSNFGNVGSIQQSEMGRSHVKSKGNMLKKNEFGVQFPVVIEVECPDCGMKFGHQSTLERHRRLHRS